MEKTLSDVKEFIETNNKRPNQNSKDCIESRLSKWLSTQTNNYRESKKIMEIKEIYDTYTSFINDKKYQDYVMTYEEVWIQNLLKVQSFIKNNNKKPYEKSKDINEKRLGQWLSDQKTKFNTKSCIMKNPNIYDTYLTFINDNKYRNYFMSKKDVWKKTMGEVQDFVKKNNKKPYEKSKDITEKRLGQWLSAQIRNHKTKSESMKIQEIYDTYTEFIGKHQKIFMKNEEIWMENLSEVQQFIEKTNKRPSSTSKDIVEKQLGTWLLRQKTNYKLKSKLMSTKKIYDLYTTFINDSRYKNFFN